MKTLFSLFVLAFSMAIHTTANAGGEDGACKSLMAGVGTRGNTVKTMSRILGIQIHANANVSTPAFERVGYNNLIKENSDLLENADSIPRGAIIVLDPRKDPTCPVSKQYGDIVMKCDDNLAYDGVSKPLDLNKLFADHKNCVQSVMFNPKFLRPDVKQLCSKVSACDKKGQTAACVSKALFGSGFTAQPIRGNAVGMGGGMNREGFSKLDSDKIATAPEGSVAVMRPGMPCASTTHNWGNVAVKCGQEWVSEAHIKMPLSRLKECNLVGVWAHPDLLMGDDKAMPAQSPATSPSDASKDE